jgi:predicted ABC-type ATPase
MPDFTVIAGPNGAGKSSFSQLLSEPGAFIFDADKVKAIKENQYPDVPVESIEMMITSAYWEAEDNAIEQNRSLTVESNLRNDFLINRLSRFKDKGYKVNLIFMLLPDVETSYERVDLRVYQKGHFVDIESIKYNFEHSLKMLKQHFGKFDLLQLFDSSLSYKVTLPRTLLILKNNNITFTDPNPPLWAKPILDEITHKLTIN